MGFSRFAAHRCFGIQRGGIWLAGAMGAFDGPTAPALDLHIFVGEKGDDDQICDRLPQNLACDCEFWTDGICDGNGPTISAAYFF